MTDNSLRILFCDFLSVAILISLARKKRDEIQAQVLNKQDPRETFDGANPTDSLRSTFRSVLTPHDSGADSLCISLN